MTIEEAKIVFLNRGYVEVEGGTIYDADKWRESCCVISKWLEQEPCEDEYIKVPKKALKYRTAGMVAYNAEWLKNHFDIERAVICGEQQPCDDYISKQAVDTLVDELARAISDERCCISRGRSTATIMQDILDLPPVKPQEKTGHWILTQRDKYIDICCSECGNTRFKEYAYGYTINEINPERIKDLIKKFQMNYCECCGAKMVEKQESEDNE